MSATSRARADRLSRGVFYAVRRWALANANVKTGNCELLALSPPRKNSDAPWDIKRVFSPETEDFGTTSSGEKFL